MEQLPVVEPLVTALALSTLMGFEREWHTKNAGLRTHTLVGVGAAVFVLISKFGFGDVATNAAVRVDPSRLAAQVVSGIGFIGAGLIFVRQDTVRGMTSAGAVWVTAAVGMACGAGLWLLGLSAVAIAYLVGFVYPVLMRRLPHSSLAGRVVRVTYLDGRGALRLVLTETTSLGFLVEDLEVHRSDRGEIEVQVDVRGRGSFIDLTTRLLDLDGVLAVHVQENGNTA